VGSITKSGTDLSTATWYSPYGEQAPMESIPSRLGCQGEITDPDTGAVDMLTRQYLPDLGRFTTRDILFGHPRDPMTLNQFSYAVANPVTFDDPLGLCADPSICPDTEGNGEGGQQLDDGDGQTETGGDGTGASGDGVGSGGSGGPTNPCLSTDPPGTCIERVLSSPVVWYADGSDQLSADGLAEFVSWFWEMAGNLPAKGGEFLSGLQSLQTHDVKPSDIESSSGVTLQGKPGGWLVLDASTSVRERSDQIHVLSVFYKIILSDANGGTETIDTSGWRSYRNPQPVVRTGPGGFRSAGVVKVLPPGAAAVVGVETWLTVAHQGPTSMYVSPVQVSTSFFSRAPVVLRPDLMP
jgi:RHS repeat-associated protein